MRKNILNDDNLYSDMLTELQAMLSEELDKPEGLRSYDTIAEITSAIAEISGGAVSDEKAASAADDITASLFANEKRSMINMVSKYLSVISACIIMLIAFNFVSLNSFGANLFDAVVSSRDDGFVIDFSIKNPGSAVTPVNPADDYTLTTGVYATTEGVYATTVVYATTYTTGYAVIPAGTTGSPTEPQYVADTTGAPQNTRPTGSSVTQKSADTNASAPNTTTAPASPAGNPGDTQGSGNVPSATDDPERITIAEHLMRECQYDDFTPCAPIEYDCVDPYIPLTDFSSEHMTDSDDYYFAFSDEEHQVDIIIEKYNDPDDIPQLIIPISEASHWKITGEVGAIYIFHKDDRMCAVFVYDNCVYTITGYNFDESFEDFAVSFRVPIQN